MSSGEQKEESFYTVSWVCGVNGNPYVAAGGVKGIIRVIDVNSETIHKVLLHFYGCSMYPSK